MGTRFRLPRPNHPFPLLLYLEWILLGIAVLTAFPGSFLVRRPRNWVPPGDLMAHGPFTFGILLCIAALGAIGLWLPIRQSRLHKMLFTALGFGLAWLTVTFGGAGGNSFSALLLVVVVRACLLFPWSGRLVVALLAFGSFVLRLVFGIQRFLDLGVSTPDRMSLRPFRRLSPEQIQGAVFNLTLNSTLLFALVLVFVLLMVGAILNERQSRDRLVLANDRLRRYALLAENQATLQERNRIAREIHDSVGHALTAQSIQLENVAMWLHNSPPRAEDHLQKARSLGKDALQNVRQSVATLRQQPLQGKNFPSALQTLLEEFERTTGIQMTFTIYLKQSVPTELAIALYRIVQEATTNIAKHSNATAAELTLEESLTQLKLSIRDNGQGFEPDRNTTGFGLQSMRERTEALNGSFQLQSQPSGGCTIQVVLPLTGEPL